MPPPRASESEPSAHKAAERVYCTYCGKGFSRKEHLERHLPTHTNVKPHRCSACQLGFARRDLLQRHFTTYHEAKNPMDSSPGGLPPSAGRTPIACLNCANAKTGCDKKVPCTRCADKNLPCEARFARRSSKAAIRAAQANAAAQGSLTQPPPTTSPAFVGVSQPVVKLERTGGSPSVIEVVVPGDSVKDSPPTISPHHTQLHMNFPPADVRIESGLEDFMQHIGADLQVPECPYPDYLTWNNFQEELDKYQTTVQISRQDTSLGGIPSFVNVSSPSEAVVPSSRTSINTPETSVMSLEYAAVSNGTEFAMEIYTENSAPEFEVVMLAEAEWNLARCNPPPPNGNCPRTAIVHLRCLEQRPNQEDTWNSLEKYMEQLDWDASDLTSVVPLSSGTRDKLLAITQSFLHKALETHRGGHHNYRKNEYGSPSDCNFIVLPPPRILEYFLRSYVRSLSVYYPLVTAGCVDPNEMLQNNQASTLLVLLMIAQGAAAMPIQEARNLSTGLTETCRISLFDIVEKDVGLSADPTTLRCALLFLVLGAWSGDKWLMDIAMGQRGMYMSMLKHAGLLGSRTMNVPEFNEAINTEVQWRVWVERETRNRLVYNYVMLDQELSLFHDTAPLFAINELQCPLPAPEVLWMSTTSEQWFRAMQSLYGCPANVNPQLLSTPSATPSLYSLFQDFLQDNPLMGQPGLSPPQMRLILHPLQAMICHLRQIFSCLSDVFAPSHPNGCPVTKASMIHRLDEVQALLQKWYDMTMSYSKTNPGCPATHWNLVLYHLVSLNAVVDFPEIERLARREGFGGQQWELPIRHGRCIFNRQKAIVHCGQIVRLLHLMPKERRPAWWPAAMYRAMLTLWADSISKVDGAVQGNKHGNSGSQESLPVMIDQLTPEDPALINYLWSGNGVPILMHPEGTAVGLNEPGNLLACAVKNIETCYSSRIGDGIKRKLIALGKNWDLELSGLSPSGAEC